MPPVAEPRIVPGLSAMPSESAVRQAWDELASYSIPQRFTVGVEPAAVDWSAVTQSRVFITPEETLTMTATPAAPYAVLAPAGITGEASLLGPAGPAARYPAPAYRVVAKGHSGDLYALASALNRPAPEPVKPKPSTKVQRYVVARGGVVVDLAAGEYLADVVREARGMAEGLNSGDTFRGAFKWAPIGSSPLPDTGAAPKRYSAGRYRYRGSTATPFHAIKDSVTGDVALFGAGSYSRDAVASSTAGLNGGTHDRDDYAWTAGREVIEA